MKNRDEPSGLVPTFEEGGPEVHVVEMERVVAECDVDTLTAARFLSLPRQVVLRVMGDRMPAQHHVAEQAAAQMTRRRHHPSHADERADFLGVPLRVRAGADDFLERNHIRVDRPDDFGHAGRIGPPVHAAAAMDVVGGDANRPPA